jgi:hypothetical protein
MTALERARANALGLRANGLSIRQIAQRLDVPRGTVGQWLCGRGEWYEVRECELCGEGFIAASGRQRFCTRAHAAKHRRVFGVLPAAASPGDRVRSLEAKLARVCARLAAYEERAA